jgi:hypothetical protein
VASCVHTMLCRVVDVYLPRATSFFGLVFLKSPSKFFTQICSLHSFFNCFGTSLIRHLLPRLAVFSFCVPQRKIHRIVTCRVESNKLRLPDSSFETRYQYILARVDGENTRWQLPVVKSSRATELHHFTTRFKPILASCPFSATVEG